MGEVTEAPWVGNPPEQESEAKECEWCGRELNEHIFIHDLSSNEYHFCDVKCLVNFIDYDVFNSVCDFLEVHESKKSFNLRQR